MTLLLSSFETFNVVIPDPSIFWWIASSLADAAAVNTNGIKTLLANDLRTFFIKNYQNQPTNPPGCPILYNWVFDNFILAYEPFAKALWISKTCELGNNNCCEKLFCWLESPSKTDDGFKVSSISIFIPAFNLLICELDNYMFKMLC